MGAAEDVEFVRRGYNAFGTGDMATLHGLFAEDAVWLTAGTGVLSGPKEGRDAILGYFGELMTRSGGKFVVTLTDLMAGNDGRVAALQHTHGEREGRTIDTDAVNLFTLSGGVVTEVREYFRDTGESDAFWA
jgi:ketosteroid isomerase-like protein